MNKRAIFAGALALLGMLATAGTASARWWGDGRWHDDDRWEHSQNRYYYGYHYAPPPVVYSTPYNYRYVAPPVIYNAEPGLNIHIGP